MVTCGNRNLDRTNHTHDTVEAVKLCYLYSVPNRSDIPCTPGHVVSMGLVITMDELAAELRYEAEQAELERQAEQDAVRAYERQYESYGWDDDNAAEYALISQEEAEYAAYTARAQGL